MDRRILGAVGGAAVIGLALTGVWWLAPRGAPVHDAVDRGPATTAATKNVVRPSTPSVPQAVPSPESPDPRREELALRLAEEAARIAAGAKPPRRADPAVDMGIPGEVTADITDTMVAARQMDLLVAIESDDQVTCDRDGCVVYDANGDEVARAEFSATGALQLVEE